MLLLSGYKVLLNVVVILGLELLYCAYGSCASLNEKQGGALAFLLILCWALELSLGYF